MIKTGSTCLMLIGAFSIMSAQGSRAQGVPTGPPAYERTPNLNAVQQEGQRVFMQRCPICHIPGTPTGRHLGPRLTKDLIAGKEDAMRQIIMAGTDRMPGFQYGLSQSQISAVIEYLKTGLAATEADQSGPPSNSKGKK
jgi:mono/diheme cytochrome c family protein